MAKERGGKNHSRFQDLTGTKNGTLEIIEYIDISNNDSNKRCWRWKCKCKCGEIIYVRTARLNGTESRQEFCRKCQGSINGKSKILPNYGSIKNSLYQRYKLRAKKRGYNFNISLDEFISIIEKDCFYCGSKPRENKVDEHRLYEDDPYLRNGVDRKDNTKGYNIENCVPCCTMCNFAKLDYSMKEFSDWLKKIKNFDNKELWG